MISQFKRESCVRFLNLFQSKTFDEAWRQKPLNRLSL